MAKELREQLNARGNENEDLFKRNKDLEAQRAQLQQDHTRKLHEIQRLTERVSRQNSTGNTLRAKIVVLEKEVADLKIKLDEVTKRLDEVQKDKEEKLDEATKRLEEFQKDKEEKLDEVTKRLEKVQKILENVQKDEKECQQKLRKMTRDAVIRQFALNVEYEVKRTNVIPLLAEEQKKQYTDGKFCSEMRIRHFDYIYAMNSDPGLKWQVLQDRFGGSATEWQEFRRVMKRLKEFSAKGAHPDKYLDEEVTFTVLCRLIDEAQYEEEVALKAKSVARWIYPESDPMMTAATIKENQEYA